MSRTNLPLTNWAGNLTYAASRVHQPESLSELRRLVAGARQIRAFGSRHPFSPVADTTGELVSLHRLPHAVTIDTAGEAVATVTAGMTYVEVAAELQKAGFALTNTAVPVPHFGRRRGRHRDPRLWRQPAVPVSLGGGAALGGAGR